MTDPLIRKIIDTDLIPTDTLLERRNAVYSYLSPVSYLTARRHRALFMHTDGILMDGSILCLFVKWFYGFKIQRPAFVSEILVPQLFKYAISKQKGIYIVGGSQDEINTTVSVLKKLYPGIAIIGYRNGYFSGEKEKEYEYRHITELAPDYVLVGMGIINQETFLINLKRTGYSGIGFACGGFISQISMKKGRYYPEWINKHNLRFLYRIYKEKHTRGRYLKAAVLFPVCFILDKIRDVGQDNFFNKQ